MRAEAGRPAEQTLAIPPAAEPQPTAKAPEQPPPDLDLLAQQVYALLRRRIAVEAERTGWR
jgi:hypothetical protein